MDGGVDAVSATVPDSALDPGALTTQPVRFGSIERHEVGRGTWIDIGRGWLPEADEVYAALHADLRWYQARLWRYDHWADEPRMGASAPPTVHPSVLAAHRELRQRYGVELMGPAFALYRDGRDALGAHRDRELRYTSNTIIALLTLGARRPWILRPRNAPRESMAGAYDLSPGSGDLMVLGGRAQADWLHGVPPVPGLIAGRMSLQWRWTSGTGPPEQGPGYRAPRNYGRG